jgi:hypothetical protein
MQEAIIKFQIKIHIQINNILLPNSKKTIVPLSFSQKTAVLNCWQTELEYVLRKTAHSRTTKAKTIIQIQQAQHVEQTAVNY